MKIDLNKPSYQQQYRRILNHSAPAIYSTTQRDEILNPQLGMLIYNKTNNKLQVYTASGWETITST